MAAARSVDLSPTLAAAAETAAAWRGLTVEQYVRKVVTAAARLDAELAADIKVGEEDIAAGRVYTQDQIEEIFNVRREHRRAA